MKVLKSKNQTKKKERKILVDDGVRNPVILELLVWTVADFNEESQGNTNV